MRAAVEVMGEDGYEGASIRDMAARSGVTVAAIYYHFPSNWAEGLRPQNLTTTLDALYLQTLPEVAATLELRLLARLATPTDCRCRELLRPRPVEYRRALSPPAS